MEVKFFKIIFLKKDFVHKSGGVLFETSIPPIFFSGTLEQYREFARELYKEKLNFFCEELKGHLWH